MEVSRAEDSPLARISLEKFAYIGLLALAAMLRLYSLGGQPLSPAEGERAYAAWQLLHGQPADIWREPATVIASTAGIFLFGDSDLTARLASALAGIGMVASVWLLRPLIGRWPSLAAAFLLAISPAFVAFSRQLGPAALASLLSLLLVACLFRYRAEGRPAFVYGAALSWALLLNTGAPGLTMTLVILLFAAGAYALGSNERNGWQSSLPEHPVLFRATLLFAAVFVLAATGLFINFQGFGFPALREWLGQFSLTSGGRPWHYHAVLALGYEPLVAVVAVLAAATTLAQARSRQANPFRLFLVVWMALAFALLLPTNRKEAWQVASFLLPAVILAGAYLAEKLAAVDLASLRQQQMALAFKAAVIMLTLMAVVRYGSGNPVIPAYLWIGLLAAWALVLILTGLIPGLPMPRGGSSSFLLLAALGLLFMLRPAQTPREPLGADLLALPGASRGVREVAQAVRTRTEAYPRENLTVDVQPSLRSPFAWYLRDVPGVSFSTSETAGAMVVAEGAAGKDMVGHVRVDGMLTRDWYPTSFSGWNIWRWVLYGEAFPDVASRKVSLYLEGR